MPVSSVLLKPSTTRHGGSKPALSTRPLTIPVTLEGTRYDIRIGRGLVSDIAPFLASITQDRKVAIACDTVFLDTLAQELTRSLETRDFTVLLHPMMGGKANKTWSELEDLYELMERNEFARDSSLIALGGGVIGDTAGFAAATFLRGINLIHVPTTVTSQIDSSIGGKVGINYRRTINAIGTYYHPRRVFIDLAFLDALPQRDFVAGLAEIIKCAVIADPALFEYLSHHARQILRREQGPLLHLYRRTIEIKLDHVRKDLREQDRRLRLNYGHTLGHAIELATAGRLETYRHGEGVALGMIGASFIAKQLWGGDGKLLRQHRQILSRFGLPVRIDLKKLGASRDELVPACLTHVRKDKKRQAMRIRFILPTAIGQTVVVDEVPPALVKAAVEMLCDGSDSDKR